MLCLQHLDEASGAAIYLSMTNGCYTPLVRTEGKTNVSVEIKMLILFTAKFQSNCCDVSVYSKIGTCQVGLSQYEIAATPLRS